jgi:hypothetical protein
MVRVSFGLYNTQADVDRTVDALTDIVANADAYRPKYRPLLDGSGDWEHTEFSFEPSEAFVLEDEVDRRLAAL